MSHNPIPSQIAGVIRRYAGLLEQHLPGEVAGSYLHGSIALDAFSEHTSDIDFLTVLAGDLTDHRRALIREIHRDLRKHEQWGARLEGIYLPAEWLGASSTEARAMYIKHGREHGRHRFDAVARMLVRARGITIAGSDALDVMPEISRDEIRREMDRNLNVYWQGQTRRPYLFMASRAVDFAVSTLPRIHHTLQTGELIGKPEALRQLRERHPQWRELADQVAERAGCGNGRMFGSIGRALGTVRFIREMIAEGNAYLGKM